MKVFFMNNLDAMELPLKRMSKSRYYKMMVDYLLVYHRIMDADVFLSDTNSCVSTYYSNRKSLVDSLESLGYGVHDDGSVYKK